MHAWADNRLQAVLSTSKDLSRVFAITYSSYKADMTAGSLLVPESRAVARLLLDGVNDDDWRQAINAENILQTSSRSSAVRIARLIRQRLECVSEDMWKLIESGSAETATHACLATAVKRHTLLADFFTTIVRQQYATFAPRLYPALWEEFLSECSSRDPSVENWSETTRRKLRNVTFQILAQAGYVDSARTLKLHRLHISKPVEAILVESGDHQVYECLNIT